MHDKHTKNMFQTTPWNETFHIHTIQATNFQWPEKLWISRGAAGHVSKAEILKISGNDTPVNEHGSGKSPSSVGNTSSKGPSSIAMLVY